MNEVSTKSKRTACPQWEAGGGFNVRRENVRVACWFRRALTETNFFEIDRRLSLLTMLSEWAAFDVADIFLNGGSAMIPRVTFMFPTTTERSSVVFGSMQSNQWMNGSLRVK